METQESYAWNCPCGRLCGKKHAHCPDCQGHWTAGTPHSNRPKSPRAYANQEDWSWEWSADHQKRGRGAKQNQKAWTRSASARARAGKGKGKGKKTDVVSPFSQSTSTPWPSPETTLAFPTPFPQQTPTAPASTAQSSDANDIELMLAVKEQYPDITKAPARIQLAVAKAEKKTTPKQLTSGLHKTSSAVGNATKELQALKDAKAKHRERWLKHLHESVQCWEQQLKLYSEQQHNYNDLIKKARQDLATARQPWRISTRRLQATTKQIRRRQSSRIQNMQTQKQQPWLPKSNRSCRPVPRRQQRKRRWRSQTQRKQRPQPTNAKGRSNHLVDHLLVRLVCEHWQRDYMSSQ